MKNFLAKFRKFTGFPFVFLLIMMLFLGVTLGTSGSTTSFGESFELTRSSDAGFPYVIFKVSAPKVLVEKDDETLDEHGHATKTEPEEVDMDVRLHDVYVNIGAIYSEEETAAMELHWGSETTEAKNFYELSDMKSAKKKLYNQSYVAPEDAEPLSADKEAERTKDFIYNAAYNWVAPFGVSNLKADASYRSLSSPIYFKLVIPKISKYTNSNMLINEIVFMGEVQKNGKGTGEYVVLNTEIDPRTSVSEDQKEGLARAQALIDAQEMPSFSQSSYHRYSKDEIKLLMTLSEMKAGNGYIDGDVYDGDKTNNSLGINLAYLGTLMFGMSPFGLRFFNVLASFGILVVGFFFTKRLFKSDKAGLSFALLYALCGVSISLAHIATPVMLGVFFLLSSLAACYRYYDKGMTKPSPLQTVPLFISGIAGALAVTVNGAFVIPLAGVVALFAAGVIKQHKKNRAVLDGAIEEAEKEKAEGIPALNESGEESEGNRRVRSSLAAYRYDTAAAASVFVCSLLVALFVFSVLFALPLAYATNKIYNDVVGVSPKPFSIAYSLFAAGFTGNGRTEGWNYLYPIFTGTGERYAVTLGIMNFAASLLGLLGIVYAVYRIVTLVLKRASLKEYVCVVLPLAGMALSLITASFASVSVAFVLLANLFAFTLVSGGAELFKKEGEKRAKAVFIGKIVAYLLLVACFALTAIFTFSVPLPAAFMAKFI